MRVVFAGSSSFSVPIFKYLLDKKLVVALLTAPDRPAGRGLKMRATPTKELALAHGISIMQPETLRKDAIESLRLFRPDLLVCAAYGKIFGPKFLSIFQKGAINIHPSLLPRFRGAAPVPATLFAGDRVTGVSVQKISLQMDCGDIISQSEYTINAEDTTESLLQQLSQDSIALIAELVANFDSLYATARIQDEKLAVYCQKIDSKLGTINWMESAAQIELMVRALSPPYSGVKARYKNAVIKIWKATALDLQIIAEEIQYTNVAKAKQGQLVNSTKSKHVGLVLGTAANYGIVVQCAQGVLALSELQMQGRKKLHWTEFIKGEADFLRAQLQ